MIKVRIFTKRNSNQPELQLLVRQRVFEKMQLIIGPYFYNYSNKYADNADGILGKSSLANQHLDSADIYSNKKYLGARWQ
jgi:hypothetical protein